MEEPKGKVPFVLELFFAMIVCPGFFVILFLFELLYPKYKFIYLAVGMMFLVYLLIRYSLFEVSKDLSSTTDKNLKTSYRLLINTFFCLIPGLLPIFTEQHAGGLSGNLYGLGQLLSFFTFIALPILGFIQFGSFFGHIKPKDLEQRKILLMSGIGLMASILGFLITWGSCASRAGFP